MPVSLKTSSTNMIQRTLPDKTSASPEELLRNISFLNNFKEKVAGSTSNQNASGGSEQIGR